MKKIYGLLGNKITYSLSPAMHNAAFEKFGIDAVYKTFDIDKKDLDSFLKGLLRSGVSGINITVPYKIDAYEFVHKFGHIDTDAEKIGAINTIVIKNGTLNGYNTDASGFVKSLKADLGFDPRMKNIFMFGAGGAGSACAVKLGRAANRIYVSDIEKEKIDALMEKFSRYFGVEKLIVVKNEPLSMRDAIMDCALVVNATPYGRNEGELLFPTDYFHKGLNVYDLTYNPSETLILKEAKRAGVKAANGLGMLLYQGAEAFSLWTGKRAPIATMRKALEKALSHTKG